MYQGTRWVILKEKKRSRKSHAWAPLRWEREDGTACCRLVMGKTQVAPKVKITIPRMELVAAVNSVRFAKKVREALRIPLAGRGSS